MPWKGKPFGWALPKPYLDFLPEPQDATVNILRHLVDEFANDNISGTLKVTVNWIEPPSTDLAIKLTFRAYNSDAKLSRKVEGVPKPDPRKSVAKFRLWKYFLRKAKPAVGRPSEELIQTCARLATQPYDYPANWHQAGEAATIIVPGKIHELLAVMVHPPAVQDAIQPWVWLQRVQLAAAQIVAHLEIKQTADVDHSALVEVIFGPIDWTIDAAVIALTQRAGQQPEWAPAVRQVLCELLDRLPVQGHWSPRETALENMLLLPGTTDVERVEIEQKLALVRSD